MRENGLLPEAYVIWHESSILHYKPNGTNEDGQKDPWMQTTDLTGKLDVKEFLEGRLVFIR